MSIERKSKKRSEKFDRVQTTIEKAKNQPKYINSTCKEAITIEIK